MFSNVICDDTPGCGGDAEATGPFTDDATLGVVVIYQLLEHKPAFTPIDHQLLELVAEHAPKALLSAHLFSAMSMGFWLRNI